MAQSDKIATPLLSHLSETCLSAADVYDPAEDSFLLLDALESQLPALRNLAPTLCVEIGSGSGVISVALASALGENCAFLATDVNPAACQTSVLTAEKNSTKLEVIQTDCLWGLERRLAGKVDILICNPPYVSTEEAECGARDISAAWAGGQDGRRLTDKILKSLPNLLTDQGVAFIVLEQCNRPDKVLSFAENELKLRGIEVMKRRAGRELLSVFRFTRKLVIA